MKPSITRLALVISVAIVGSVAHAAGVDSRTYTCAALHSRITEHGFVFISQATFGDFAVANASHCSGGGKILELRSVATSDYPE
jgi:hypothetical protein